MLQPPDGLIVVLLLPCLPLIILMLRCLPLAILLLRCGCRYAAAGLLAGTSTCTYMLHDVRTYLRYELVGSTIFSISSV